MFTPFAFHRRHSFVRELLPCMKVCMPLNRVEATELHEIDKLHTMKIRSLPGRECERQKHPDKKRVLAILYESILITLHWRWHWAHQHNRYIHSIVATCEHNSKNNATTEKLTPAQAHSPAERNRIVYFINSYWNHFFTGCPGNEGWKIKLNFPLTTGNAYKTPRTLAWKR